MARDLNDTLMFVRVVEHGSFIAAARALQLPKTNVSRKVQDLEERLGAQLLHRTTRKLGLTEAGKVYFELCQRIAQDLDEAESAVGQLQGGPRGWLRVTASYEVGIEWIAPLLDDLQTRHPDMRMELVLEAFNSDPLDLIDKEIDVAVRAGKLPDSTLAARRLAVLHTHLYATHHYLERHGEPEHPEDLRHHRTLAMAKHFRKGVGYAWPLHADKDHRDVSIDPAFVANDPAGLRVALLADQGIMMAGDIMVRRYADAGTLRRVLPAWSGPEFELNAVFPRGRVQSPKVRAFVDFLVERLVLDARGEAFDSTMPVRKRRTKR
ncbi:LysR substrate-binding domain-containing protein [Lysobacter sp. KIS68-7]|uniref:LysR family transcriptional regulator n=1 Tax=Lysobacter sp. KIS68-7 TaxID=2904252 RepID=UPI001E4CB649|nr:LysR family transcriptional regulator [Lysobacter sp. KIS68-7]UHQ19087.1 LysR substrate-binding domain-containing protein [Lysobacter sp. KIS68-7]